MVGAGACGVLEEIAHELCSSQRSPIAGHHSIRLRRRKNNRKCGTLTWTRTREDVAAVILYYFFAHSQTDTGALVLGF